MASPINHSLDSQSKVAEIITVCVVAVCASLSVVILRFYVRINILKAVGLDDWFIAIAQFCSIGTSLTVALRTRYGLGRHVWVVDPALTEPHIKVFLTSGNIYNFALMFLKISFLLQFARIFPSRTMQTICRIWIVIVTLIGIGSMILCTFPCRPVRSLWTPSLPGKCVNNLVIYLSTSVLNLITDVIIFTIPLPVIRTLQLPKKQKIILFCIFCLGFFTCSISIIRLGSMKKSVYTKDPTWDGLPPALWSVGELNVGIICSCLPTLRPLISRFSPQIRSISEKSNKYVRSKGSNKSDVEMGSQSSKPTGASASSREYSDGTNRSYPDSDAKDAKVAVTDVN